MRRKFSMLLTVLMTASILLSACAAAATAVPAPTQAPTQLPTLMATIAAPNPTTSLSTPSSATGSSFEGLSSGLDNSKQARIRVAVSVNDAPVMDVYINGVPATNGGVLQQNLNPGDVSGFLYVAPGTYTVALVPHGGALAQALFEPVTVKAEAGHRYTVAQTGEQATKDVKPLVIDETTSETAIGAKADSSIIIELNNVKGAAGIDEQLDGKAMATNIPYGGETTFLCPADNGQDQTIVTGHPETVLQGPSYILCEPGVSYFVFMDNATLTTMNGNGSQGTSELNALDLLAGFNSHHVIDSSIPQTFNTFLAAIDKAGMHDLYNNSASPYLLLAPTDYAFDALPQAQKDALLNDPKALANLLKALTVDGYFPAGSLNGSADHTITNRLGQKIIISSDTVNGCSCKGPDYTVRNGVQVQIIDSMVVTGK
jgi:uncharacterized surface protein with fasciclin (FAS1) repeats